MWRSDMRPNANDRLWEQSAGSSGPATKFTGSRQCSQNNQLAQCQFEDDIFKTRVLDLVKTHSAAVPSQPLFLFWAAHACHGPRSVPMETYNKFAFIKQKQRRMCAATARAMLESPGASQTESVLTLTIDVVRHKKDLRFRI